MSQVQKTATETACTACRSVFVRSLFPETEHECVRECTRSSKPPSSTFVPCMCVCVYSVCLHFKDLSKEPKTG